jgi:hypothetical protein
VWLHRKEILKPRYFVWVAGCAVLAVAQYGYLWWRTRAGSPYLETTVRSVGDLVRVWRGGQFQGDMWAFGPVAFVTDRLPMLGRLAIREWALLLVPAVLGVVVQWRRERSVAVFLLLAVALPTFFALEYDIGDLDPYFVTLWLAVAYFVAVACDAAHNWCRERSRALGTAALVAAVFVPIAFVAWNWSAVDRRDDVHTMEKWAQVADTLPRGSYVVSTDYATSEVIWYYQFGERRGDVGAMTLDPKTAAAAVEAYVRNGTPLTGPITGTIPAGKRLYLADPEVQRELTERGVQLAPAPNQWVLEVRP